MITGKQFIEIAERHKGEQYILGSKAPKNDADFNGPWDCAELVSWVVFQATGRLFGCLNNRTLRPETADAGTIYWDRDVNNKSVNTISMEKAANTIGAILLRVAEGGQHGHIVFSKGDGSTIEAMGQAYGVRNGVVSGRRWSYAIEIPGVVYDVLGSLTVLTPAGILRIGANNNPERVKAVQNILGITADGIFGKDTAAAVRDFQNNKGLTPDGEVGQNTRDAMHLVF